MSKDNLFNTVILFLKCSMYSEQNSSAVCPAFTTICRNGLLGPRPVLVSIFILQFTKTCAFVARRSIQNNAKLILQNFMKTGTNLCKRIMKDTSLMLLKV